MGEKIDITVLTGVSAGDVFHFTPERGGTVTIGRNPDRDIVLQDASISRNHAAIEHRDNGFFILDHGSAHGTIHMGFQVVAGPEGARRLNAGDEFKVGDHLFRVNFNPKVFTSAPADTGAAPEKGKEKKAASKSRIKLPPMLQSKRVKALGIVVLALVCVMLVMPEEEKGLPAQKSNEVLPVPEFRVLGNWSPPGAKKDDRDRTHIDKVQLSVPPSDVLIEYDFRSEVPVELLLDGIVVEKLQPVSYWQVRSVIIRGIALGADRRLVFDNTDFPKTTGAPSPKPKSWAIRDVRATPLSATGIIETPSATLIASAAGLVEGTDKSPGGLFTLVRALQTAIVGLLHELKVDAVGYAVESGSEATIKISEVTDIKSRLDLIQQERSGEASAARLDAHLRELSNIASQLDAELWRRVNSRMSQARRSAKVKDYIVAHDELIAAQQMFPGEQDYRWALLNRLFKEEKVVPKRVRQNPGKFRKD